MTTQISDRGGEASRVQIPEEGAHSALPSDPRIRAAISSAGTRSNRWYSSFGITSRSLELGPAGPLEELADESPPLQGHDLPACRGEHGAESLDLDIGDDSVQGLWFRSTTHSSSPRRATAGSATASQMAPSSSSASPMRLMNRPAGWQSEE